MGNVHRSRLAEAYARSRMPQEWQVTSSGLRSATYPPTYLTPWARILGRQHEISQWFSPSTTQTSTTILNRNDIIVFMSKDVYEEAMQKYDVNRLKCLVWNIKDREDWGETLRLRDKRRRTFNVIKRHVDQLIREVHRGGWVDIVDENNRALDFSLPISIANINGAWHRGCHAIMTTPGNYTLVQKRSKRIVFSPSLVDVTLGGHIDAGEQPTQAMVREVLEEIGLRVAPQDLRLLEIHKRSSYHPHYKYYSKIFIYAYHVPIAEDNPQLTLQTSEVQSVKLLSPLQLKRLLKRRRLRHIGQLDYGRAFLQAVAEQAGII